MKRLLSPLCSLLSALGLSACDPFHIQELRPGVSTAAEVRERFGPPGREWRNPDGSATWEYTRQPQGVHCYMITIGPDNVLRAIDQVLNEASFARIQAGMTGDEVRRILGQPGSVQSFELSRETVWNWHIEAEPSLSGALFFTVHFDTGGRVVRTSRNIEHAGG